MKTFTQKQVADALGVRQPTVSKYFNGVLEISAKDALALNRKFKIPFDVWENPKSYLQKDDTPKKNEQSSNKE
jgi:transcriptional regulator with XRE-family HTH domain